ncbi:MAG: molybdenum cofactor guanylyltransferase MobA [Pseudomonadota bacterium]
MPTEHPGVILAGGLARRMGGGDKALLDLGGRPILAHVIERLEPQTSTIAINANGDPSRFERYGLPILSDPMPDYPGPLAGVLAGLLWAKDNGYPAIITVAADTPFFPKDLASGLKTAAAQSPSGLALAATPDETGRERHHPTFGLWPVALTEDLRQALHEGTRKVVLFTKAHGAQTACFPAGPLDPFFNVNTPSDKAMAETLLRAHTP